MHLVHAAPAFLLGKQEHVAGQVQVPLQVLRRFIRHGKRDVVCFLLAANGVPDACQFERAAREAVRHCGWRDGLLDLLDDLLRHIVFALLDEA